MQILNLTNTGIVGKTHKSWKASKVLKRENTLREIFKERVNVKLGLTKKEIIAKFYNEDINDVLRFSPNKISDLWEEVNETRRRLRKEKLIAIYPVLMSSGTELNDSSLSNPISTRKRILTQTTNVYFSCSDMNTALSIRKKLDKIVEGVNQAGDDIEEITEEGIKQEQILRTIQ